MKYRLINHTEGWRNGALRVERDIPVDVAESVRRDFTKVLLTYNIRGVDFEEHWYASPGSRIPTIAWTGGGKVALMFERADQNPGGVFWLGRDAPRDFLLFLMFHEVAHNYWPPEGVICTYVANRLAGRAGRAQRNNASITSQLVDILVNAHICQWSSVNKHQPFTGKQLIAAKFKNEPVGNQVFPRIDWLNKSQVEGIWNDRNLPAFYKWQLYFLHDEQLPVPRAEQGANGRPLLPILKKILGKRPTELVYTWRDDFYELWMNAMEAY